MNQNKLKKGFDSVYSLGGNKHRRGCHLSEHVVLQSHSDRIPAYTLLFFSFSGFMIVKLWKQTISPPPTHTHTQTQNCPCISNSAELRMSFSKKKSRIYEIYKND